MKWESLSEIHPYLLQIFFQEELSAASLVLVLFSGCAFSSSEAGFECLWLGTHRVSLLPSRPAPWLVILACHLLAGCSNVPWGMKCSEISQTYRWLRVQKNPSPYIYRETFFSVLTVIAPETSAVRAPVDSSCCCLCLALLLQASALQLMGEEELQCTVNSLKSFALSGFSDIP